MFGLRLFTRKRDKEEAAVECPPYVAAVMAVMKDTNRVLNAESASEEVEGDTEVRAVGERGAGREELEEELLRLREVAEATRHAQSVFLDNMSHEIRTPLTSIIGFASALGQQESGKYREYARHIEEDGFRLLDTLNAMLTLAQLEADQLDLQLEPLPVCIEIQEIVRQFEPQARDKDLTLTLRLEEGAEHAQARLDGDVLGRIMHNLIQNAIKFTAQGGITVAVSREKDQAALNGHGMAPCVCVRVQDTGVGIDPAFMPHLFTAFRQESTGTSRSHEGAGLGLAITKRFVELLNGAITVESEKGTGSVFSVYFPLVGEWDDSATVPAPVALTPSTTP